MRRLALVFVLFLAGCASVPPPEPVHLVIVGTTDVHGWFNGRVDDGVERGGVALFAGYVDALRAKHGDRVIVVDSGDMFQGTLESNLFEGEPVVKAYNAVGYAAAAVGNHEFDFGPVGPRVRAQAGEDELGALKKAVGLAKFPFLSANMKERQTGRTPAWAKPYVMIEAGGAKVGIIGLSTPDTPNVTVEANVRSLVFTDPVPATIEAARHLRAQGADAVIVVAHMGGRCEELREPRDLSSCQEGHEANQLLQALPPGTIDAYLAGHTHRRMRHFINGVPAAQAGAYSEEFSTIELWVDTRADRVVAERSSIRMPTPICAQVYAGTDDCDPREGGNASLVPRVFEGVRIARNASVQAAVAPYLAQVAEKRNQPLGLTAAAEFRRNRSGESALGNLLADAMRAWTGADIAFMNSGGIRADLDAGSLVYADMFEVSPFENYPAVVTMTGQQVIDALNAVSTGERGLIQVSGIHYIVDAAAGHRVVSVTLPDGTPIDVAGSYRVVMPDFLAHGGDGMAPVMNTIPAERIAVDQDAPLRDIVIEVLQKRGTPLTPVVEGRVTVLNRTAGRSF